MGDTTVVQTKISNAPVRFYRPIRILNKTTIMEGQKFSKADDVNVKSTSKRSQEDEGELMIHSPLDPKKKTNSALNEFKRLSVDTEKGGEMCVTRGHVEEGGVEDDEHQRVLTSASVYAYIYNISMARDRDHTCHFGRKFEDTYNDRTWFEMLLI